MVIGGIERKERGGEKDRQTDRRNGRQRVREKTPSSCTKSVKKARGVEGSYKK
jgi:hypothetical protein